MTASRGKLLIDGLLVFLLLLGLLQIFFSSGGLFFVLGFVCLIVLLVLSLVSFINYDKSLARTILFSVFLFSLAGLILIYLFFGKLYLTLLLIGLLGFLLNLPDKVKKKKVPKIEIVDEPHSVVFDESSSPVGKTERKAPVKKSKTTYSPGKFVASKQSNVYHLPKCDWAKRIKKHRQNWFKNKEEAWEQGYKAHSCV